MSNFAVILAGGLGTRLKPYTITIPKPLVPINEKPVLELLILQLKSQGFDTFVITLNHFSNLIKAYFGDGSNWGVKIRYSEETKRLSTMGPLSLIPDLPENFLVINSDVLSDLNIREMWAKHISQNSIFTVGTKVIEVKSEFGELIENKEGSIIEFKEKPTTFNKVSMGVYIANRRILKYIPKNTFYGFDHLLLDLIEAKEYAKTFIHEGYWLDIGRPSDYEQAQNYTKEEW